MVMPEATIEFIRELGGRGAHEVELYEWLGFPDGFGHADTHIQTLLFEGQGDCQVTLFGGRVVGHPHDTHSSGEWDGVVRPKNIREFRRHVQQLSRSIRPESPLGVTLVEVQQMRDSAHGAPWRRAVHWWALSQSSP